MDKLKKSKIPITCQKNTFGELSSKILLKPSGILLYLRNSEKNGFAELVMQKSGLKLNKLNALACKQLATPENNFNFK